MNQDLLTLVLKAAGELLATGVLTVAAAAAYSALSSFYLSSKSRVVEFFVEALGFALVLAPPAFLLWWGTDFFDLLTRTLEGATHQLGRLIWPELAVLIVSLAFFAFFMHLGNKFSCYEAPKPANFFNRVLNMQVSLCLSIICYTPIVLGLWQSRSLVLGPDVSVSPLGGFVIAGMIEWSYIGLLVLLVVWLVRKFLKRRRRGSTFGLRRLDPED